MDLHTYFNGSHIYFSDKEGVDVNLDVDDRDDYGPKLSR